MVDNEIIQLYDVFCELDEFMVCQFLGILFVMVLKLGQLFL